MSRRKTNLSKIVLLALIGILPLVSFAQIKATEQTKLQAEPYKSVQVGPYSQVMTNFGTLVTQIPLAGLAGKGKTSIQFGLSHRSQNSPSIWPDKSFGQGFGNSAVEYLQMQNFVMTRYSGGYGRDSWAASVPLIGGGYEFKRKPGVRDDLANTALNKYVLTDFESKTVYTYDYFFQDIAGTRFYLTKVKDVFGNEVNYSYVSGKLDQVTDASGRYLKFLYIAGTERVSQVNLVTPDNTLSWNFNYVAATAGNNHLDSIQLPPPTAGGVRPTIEFDQDNQGNITYLRDPKGQLWRYDYSTQVIETFGSGLGLAIHEIFAVSKTYAPDQSNPLFVSNSKFTQFVFQNNSTLGERTCTITRPQVTSVFGVLNPVEKHVYYSAPATSPDDFPMPIKRVFDPPTTRFLNPRTSQVPTVWNWWETYESWDVLNGNLLKHTDREARITELTYDSGGRGLVTSIKKNSNLTNANVRTTETMTYTTDGLLDTATDASGTVTKNTYHPTTRALIMQQVDPTGRNLTKSYQYTASGSLELEWVGTDAPTTYSNFDIYGNARTVRPPNGSLATETYFTFDSKGNKLTVDPPGSQGVTTTIYDLWNRPVKVVFPDGNFTETGYDNLGNVISAKAEDGSMTTMEYDPIGGLKKTTQPVDNTPANNLITQHTFNAIGWKTATINPEGQGTTHWYNQRGDLVKLDYPDGTNRQWGYDGVGNVVWKQNGRGQITYYQHDALSRLVLTDYQTSTTADVSYGYRLDGLRSSRTDEFGTSTWTYNSAKQLESHYDAATQKTISSSYASVSGRPETVTAGSNTWTTGYDAMYRPSKTFQTVTGSTPLAELEFGDDQSVFRRKTLNNNTAEFTYDSRGRVSGIRHYVTSSNADLVTMSYAYRTGYLWQYRLTSAGFRHSTSYGHDFAGRITSEGRTSPGLPMYYTNRYYYDKSGNRTQVDRVAAVSSSSQYSTGPNDRFLSGDGYSFGYYDNDGNPQLIATPNAGTWTLTYDDESRLTAISRQAGLIQFRYNGDGQRVERVQLAGTTRYLYNGDNVILTTNGIAPYTVQEYITPGVGLFKVGQSVVNPGPLSATAAAGTAASVPGQMIFNQENALGSTIATRNADGSLGGRWEYDAFGIEWSRPASGITVDLRTDFRFAGKHGYISDPDTGFDLLGARYYIPRLGRFLTQDPIGHAGGLNLYAYCENSPLLKVDPDGKDWVSVLAKNQTRYGLAMSATGLALSSEQKTAPGKFSASFFADWTMGNIGHKVRWGRGSDQSQWLRGSWIENMIRNDAAGRRAGYKGHLDGVSSPMAFLLAAKESNNVFVGMLGNVDVDYTILRNGSIDYTVHNLMGLNSFLNIRGGKTLGARSGPYNDVHMYIGGFIKSHKR